MPVCTEGTIQQIRHLRRLRPVLKARLKPDRYHHCMQVAARGAELARIHGADWFQAALAGMLHDICQGDRWELQLKYLHSHGILLDDFTMTQPQIWHAQTGSLLLWELGVRDRGVLQAVRYHTTGRPEMSLLEKVVFLADATSSDRTYPGVSELRALSDQDLDVAMRTCLWYTLQDLVEKGQPIVRDSWAAYNYYTKKLS